MKVCIYVEGPSDKIGMACLLRPLIEQKRKEGIIINFFEAPSGDKKASILKKVPQKAVNILINDPHSFVVAMPDLYPKDKVFKHETFDELKNGISQKFCDAMKEKKVREKSQLMSRFKIFCFKYEFESLLLASKEALKKHIGIKSLGIKWKTPVEDQNHQNPPKTIIRQIFNKYGKKYKSTVDAPLILSASNYHEIADNCPQCFKPFVDFLTNLQA